MTQHLSPLSGRPAKYFRAVNYGTGLASKVCETLTDATTEFTERFSEGPVGIICATSKDAAWWWDTEGQPDRLTDRRGRTVGEVWTVPA